VDHEAHYHVGATSNRLLLVTSQWKKTGLQSSFLGVVVLNVYQLIINDSRIKANWTWRRWWSSVLWLWNRLWNNRYIISGLIGPHR